MDNGDRKVSALVLAIVSLGLVQLPFGCVGGDLSDGGSGPTPMAGEPVWTDGLDDLSHVYMTDRVEVVGGAARLMAGEPQGWIASEVITCPEGYRYDLVYLEAELPGASQVLVSVLNASKESSEVGFANETIPPHAKVNGTDHSVYDVSPGLYPRIRIQVNLVASGTDRPRLLAWSLYYIGLDEWHDDFLGWGKMASHRGLNFTGGEVGTDSGCIDHVGRQARSHHGLRRGLRRKGQQRQDQGDGQHQAAQQPEDASQKAVEPAQARPFEQHAEQLAGQRSCEQNADENGQETSEVGDPLVAHVGQQERAGGAIEPERAEESDDG